MRYVILCLLTSILLFINSCNTNSINIDNLVFPATNVSYQNQVQPFMQFYCTYGGCHSDTPTNGASVMSDWVSLYSTENLGLIVPTNPDGSKLYQTVNKGKLPHNPYLYWTFKDNHVQGIRQWILEGGKNN